ncbi:hypothetical protein EV426DRAFT_709422 [Tirmania nivea]|nr:hypothetical protein EV426DRAFT_709422 [Tirmania nivea]
MRERTGRRRRWHGWAGGCYDLTLSHRQASDRRSPWDDLQAGEEEQRGATRPDQPSPATARISIQTSGEQPSRTFPPRLKPFELLFSPLSHETTSTEHWSTTAATASTPRAVSDATPKAPSVISQSEIEPITGLLDHPDHASPGGRHSRTPR